MGCTDTPTTKIKSVHLLILMFNIIFCSIVFYQSLKVFVTFLFDICIVLYLYFNLFLQLKWHQHSLHFIFSTFRHFPPFSQFPWRSLRLWTFKPLCDHILTVFHCCFCEKFPAELFFPYFSARLWSGHFWRNSVVLWKSRECMFYSNVFTKCESEFGRFLMRPSSLNRKFNLKIIK